MGKRIGYARVSTDAQNLDLQRDAPTLARCSTLYEETANGRSANRPELESCLKALRSGDTLVVWRLDRLGRSLPDLVGIVSGLEQENIARAPPAFPSLEPP
jgi:DNA invertase Pin-like site-specific DNA recombinase